MFFLLYFVTGLGEESNPMCGLFYHVHTGLMNAVSHLAFWVIYSAVFKSHFRKLEK